ncbi:MAG: betaine-aldehyde dehydrogenase [Spirochaetota bacterium]
MKLSQQKLFIHGRHVDAKAKETFVSRNPATAEVLCEVQLAGSEDVDAAITSARKGFLQWSTISGIERGRVLIKASQILRKRTKELAALEVMDSGKPLAEALEVDITTAADALEYYGGLATTLRGEFYDLGSSHVYTRREPLGVCVGIGAWNYPIQIACWKSAPALACGNAMVFKPSELTPLTALKLAEIYLEAGLPRGVFNVVQGAAATGQFLTRHPGVAKVSFTGEVATGKKIMADVSATLKPATMELGGKSPLLVFADANLENAAKAALAANFYTQGEVCTNATRVFVQEEIVEPFMQVVLERMKKVVIGDPMQIQTNVGALISEEHKNKVLQYIATGEAAGAKIHKAGTLPDREPFCNGYFVQPVIFTECQDGMKIVQEEIFGPVMSVLSFRDEGEAIRRANATLFGLAAGVFTEDLRRAHRVVAKLEAGICWINNYNITPMEMPFGGFKESGLGKENGLVTLEHYTKVKSVYVEMQDVESPF